MWRMLATFGWDYKRILDYLAANGAECIDMPYARYLDINWELELNIGKLATFFVVDKEEAFLCWHVHIKVTSGRGESQLPSAAKPALCSWRSPGAVSTKWRDIQGDL